jgi:glycine/D-amino acid oxidase-like deaminating enzyme
VRADVHSPTYLAGLWTPAGGLVDPVAMTTGLRYLALRKGVMLHEHSQVQSLERDGARMVCRTAGGSVRADQVILASNGFLPLLRRIRSFVLPVWDHVLATEPLSAGQLARIGWARNQGLTDAGNQFHYYRRTADDRILWGGYDAIYYFGNRTDAAREQRDASHRLLAKHFYATFHHRAALGRHRRTGPPPGT